MSADDLNARSWRWLSRLLPSLPWAAASVFMISRVEPPGDQVGLWALCASCLGLSLVLQVWAEGARWSAALTVLSSRLDAMAMDPAHPPHFEVRGPLEVLADPLSRLASTCRSLASRRPTLSMTLEESSSTTLRSLQPPSGLLDSRSDVVEPAEPNRQSAEFIRTNMVNRLDPKLFRWIESSRAEQDFLGWGFHELRQKSFLEIVHPDDLDRVTGQLQEALEKGELHGMACRIRTAAGKLRVVAVNIGARFAPDMSVSHLRCHLTDITNKIRADRELRVSSRELKNANNQLRRINEELEELKEKYRDLYEKAPAMYFSLDPSGRILDCNDTLVQTLGYAREGLIGQPYPLLLPEALREYFPERFARYLERGEVEVQSQWVKAGGEVIDVWVHGVAVRDDSGQVLHSRSVAQDVTSRLRLEAELVEKNAQLAKTIEELSARNREMDQFIHVVSHDLQEPIRTLIAFSDFLQQDFGDRLDQSGREYVQHIVDASNRMRALILDLLALARAGKVAAEFRRVDLHAVVDVVKADLGELIRTKDAEVAIVGPLPQVWGDRDRLGQLLANLVANGLKYNKHARPRIEISALNPNGAAPASEARATISVKDNGIGIEPQFHERIFQLFQRLHTRDEFEGTGAGLAICAKIAQAHGGRAWVESQPGKGSTFFVNLPLAPAE